jgi:hypothetical protein
MSSRRSCSNASRRSSACSLFFFLIAFFECIDAAASSAAIGVSDTTTANPLLLGHCQGNCQIHDDCQPGLICFDRNDRASVGVPGCTPSSDGGSNTSNADAASSSAIQDGVNYCIPPSTNFTHLTYISQRGPLGRCAGDCDSDDDCIDELVCYQRKDRPYDIPYKCQGSPWGSVDYCVEAPPSDEYVPGFLTATKHGVHLSNGLDIRPIAQSGQPLVYANGTRSNLPFHALPDYGACFEDATGRNLGGWAYASNSEVKDGGGGVGVIIFNSDGEPIAYDKLLEGTSRNCGGGATSWGTFISCEEYGDTHCHELDPFGGLVDKKESRTALGGVEGGNFESFAFDERDLHQPHYFVTEDRKVGPLRRYRPATDGDNIESDAWTNPYRNMLFRNGTIEYLVLEPTNEDGQQGTFYWTPVKEEAQHAAHIYSNAEGIDVKDGIMYFTARRNTDIFVLDLDNANYTRINVPSDGINLSADQLVRLSGDDSGTIYITNHGWMAGAAGVYTRDVKGRFSTILESTVNEEDYRLDRLTTGLTFSPNGKHMYVCFQRAGVCFDVWRKDRKSFAGRAAHTLRYHL